MFVERHSRTLHAGVLSFPEGVPTPDSLVLRSHFNSKLLDASENLESSSPQLIPPALQLGFGRYDRCHHAPQNRGVI